MFANSAMRGPPVGALVASLADEFGTQFAAIKNNGTKVIAADLDAIREVAEAAWAASFVAYGNAPQTAKLRANILAAIGQILVMVEPELEGRRQPTDEEICRIIDQQYLSRMPGITAMEKTLRPLIREQYLPASNEQLRRVLDRPEYKIRRRLRGRPPMSK